ncbi:MAG: serine hydrolase [Dehalococcoidia bacterium]
MPTAVPTPPPTAAPTPQSLEALAQNVVERLDGYRGIVGLAVRDLQTGQGFQVNGETRVVAASVIKIFVLLSVLKDLEVDLYDLEAVAADIDAMMSVSDNEAAARLTTRTGIANVNQLMQALGMEDSIYHSWPGVAEVYGPPGQNYLTAIDAVTALAKLYQRETLSPQFTELALQKMMQSIPSHNTIIPRHLPDDVKVAHKIGFLPGPPSHLFEVHSDAGIVLLPPPEAAEGEIAYAIAFLSQDNPSHQGAADLGAQLSRLVFDYFAAHYGVQAAPGPP